MVLAAMSAMLLIIIEVARAVKRCRGEAAKPKQLLCTSCKRSVVTKEANNENTTLEEAFLTTFSK